MLFSIVGMLGLASCLELVSLFVALEIMSVAIYAMAGLHRDRVESQEAAVKYFITGASRRRSSSTAWRCSTASAAAPRLARIAAAIGARPRTARGWPCSASASCSSASGSRWRRCPFHMWAPDVYEGAPTTVTALMSAGVKAAAFAAFLRVFLQAVPALAAEWQPAVAVLAIVTMVIGNLGALAQTNIKRMLAYSSVAHAGYILTAVVAAPGRGRRRPSSSISSPTRR